MAKTQSLLGRGVLLLLTLGPCLGLWFGPAALPLASAPLLGQQTSPVSADPMQPVEQDGAEFRWLHKPVLKSRPLDGMEDLAPWSLAGDGQMTLSTAEVKEGQHSLRLRSNTSAGRVNGDGDWQDLLVTRHFAAEDWRAFNRISLWVYPDVQGAPALNCSLILHNQGAHIVPDSNNEGRNESIPLRNHQWNHVVWEIASLDRDKITGLDFGYSQPRMIPDPGDQTVFYLDKLDLESVAADHVEGWDVAPGTIAFSHSGYAPGSQKTAIASGLSGADFSVIDTASGNVVLQRPIELRKTALGSYQVLDFSGLRKPGNYMLRSGSVFTRPFRIGDDAWRNSILKALNFMYSERCGTVIPGIHGVCHQDDYTIHDGKRIIVNGGYHDAGDTSATGNITGMSYALLDLADRLAQRGEDSAPGGDPALYNQVVAEAKWGLAWILKTSFGKGYRSTGQLISYWTDNIMGDADDRFGEAVNDPEWNFRVAAVEAHAARTLKQSDPQLANRSLATAEEDWSFAVEGLSKAASLPQVYGEKDDLERISFGVIASIDLFRATGEARYSEEALVLARQILASQETRLQPWTLPMTGYFYTGPDQKAVFHRFHIGQEEEPIVALAQLCEAFPNHAEWIKWYTAIVLHSVYYQQVAAEVDAPFNMLPASVYHISEADQLPVSRTWTPLRTADRDIFREQVRQGVPLGGDAYLRRFPVWFDFRGNSSVLLSSAKALSTAAQLRGDLAAEDLAQQQAQWLVGRNPFSASIMYGEGYDWTPLYSVRSGQLVGAIPVGIETKGAGDAPYWPTQSCWTYKEVWTQPVGEWIWLMRDLSGSALIEGDIDKTSTQPVELVDRSTGETTPVTVDSTGGTFRAAVSQGRYTLRSGTTHTSIDALPGGRYRVDLRRGSAIDYTVQSKSAGSADITIELTADGAGDHTFTVRAANLELIEPASRQVHLGARDLTVLTWHARVLDSTTPWVAVLLADGSLDQHRELTGVASSN